MPGRSSLVLQFILNIALWFCFDVGTKNVISAAGEFGRGDRTLGCESGDVRDVTGLDLSVLSVLECLVLYLAE